jgi:UDP-N-acetyl-D-mannosaminuronate dehydrogenase
LFCCTKRYCGLQLLYYCSHSVDKKITGFNSLYKSSETVGKVLKKGDIVIYESTVYPGVTEEECVLEKYQD